MLGGSCGGSNLNAPTGGAAYLIPSHCVTPLDNVTPWYLLYDKSTSSISLAHVAVISKADKMTLNSIACDRSLPSRVFFVTEVFSLYVWSKKGNVAEALSPKAERKGEKAALPTLCWLLPISPPLLVSLSTNEIGQSVGRVWNARLFDAVYYEQWAKESAKCNDCAGLNRVIDEGVELHC